MDKPSDITWVIFSQNTAATFDVVAASTTGKRIKVCGAILVAGAAVGIQFKDGTPTNMSPNFPIGANGGFVLPTSRDGYMEPTAANKKLTLTLDAAVQVSGLIGYRMVD